MSLYRIRKGKRGKVAHLSSAAYDPLFTHNMPWAICGEKWDDYDTRDPHHLPTCKKCAKKLRAALVPGSRRPL